MKTKTPTTLRELFTPEQQEILREELRAQMALFYPDKNLKDNTLIQFDLDDMLLISMVGMGLGIIA